MVHQGGSGREVTLDPNLQTRLLANMRKEQAAALRARAIRRYVVLPLVLALMTASLVMSFSPDAATAMIGQLIASTWIFLVWKKRRSVASAIGL